MATLSNGYQLIDDFLTPHEVDNFNRAASTLTLSPKSGGIRNIEQKLPYAQELISSDKLLNAAQKYLKGTPQFIRAILFNKTPENNWLVSWHQDKTIAVSDKFEKTGWGPWTLKAGVHHVQPPLEVLNNMVTFRIHLDDTNENNGCLKLIPGSHHEGVMTHAEIQSYIKDKAVVTCLAKAGSALVMRPHLLHSSSKAFSPSQRRVLHIEYRA
jgi:ectoine hydroxylase-related dioxygenase (phytanoyl-CoA dioxygenase family)